MQFIANGELLKLSNDLTFVTESDLKIKTSLEYYSTRNSHSYRVSHSLDEQMSYRDVNISGLSFTNSAIDNEATLSHLTTVLAQTFTDYDFSTVSPDQFDLDSWENVARDINSLLSSAMGTEYASISQQLWNIIRSLMSEECEIFSYKPDEIDDPLVDAIWSFNYFFYSRRKFKLLFFTCVAEMNTDDESDYYDMD
ncbi:hypothetical protein PCE1_004514 [Barthelona sp. PCE]